MADWRDPNAECIICPYCDGRGKAYAQLGDGLMVTRTFSEDEKELWEALPPEDKGETECPHCEGYGRILIDEDDKDFERYGR